MHTARPLLAPVVEPYRAAAAGTAESRAPG
jgi:hypothetical protein